MTIRRVSPDSVYDTGVYAQVVAIDRAGGGRSIHVAGTFGADRDRNIIGPGDMAAQVVAAMENVKRSLEAVDATIDDVVRVKWYVTDLSLMLRDGRGPAMEAFGGKLPASTAVEVNALAQPGALVEVEVYAEVGE